MSTFKLIYFVYMCFLYFMLAFHPYANKIQIQRKYFLPIFHLVFSSNFGKFSVLFMYYEYMFSKCDYHVSKKGYKSAPKAKTFVFSDPTKTPKRI